MPIEIKWSPFSHMALKSMVECDAWINIWEGAVRSSKTVSSIIAWITFIEESEHNVFLMTGNTSDTLYRNVIGGDIGILTILGNRAKYVKGGDGGAHLKVLCKRVNPQIPETTMVEKICWCVGAHSAPSENRIRGMTVGGWYADEVTLYPENVVKQAINRMSLSGARAFWTCNPDSPYHYIKTEFIDQAKKKGVRVFKFTIDDNLSLDERYKTQIKSSYSGLWYKRMIQGLWVMADGVIYDMFNHEPVYAGGMVCARLPDMQKYWISIDYGTSNATTFHLYGWGVDDKLYAIKEYYHSGKESEDRQKSPQQYADDFVKWIDSLEDIHGNKINYEYIFIDPSAKGFMLQLWQQGVKKVQAADNDVKIGIELVSSVMGQDRFRVHVSCVNMLRELSSYVWDPNAQKRGEDKPLKENDHCLDNLRYCVNGTRKIWNRKVAA